METAPPNDTADALAVIRGFYPSLSPAEKKVGDYILREYERVLRMTLAEVAGQSGVSDATAVRFFRSLGYQGWLDFKIALGRVIPSSPQLILDNIETGDLPGVLARKVLHGSVQALEDTLAVLDESAFARALDLLGTARSILIAGVGTSGPMAHEMYNRLFRLGLSGQVVTDAYLQVMQASLLTSAGSAGGHLANRRFHRSGPHSPGGACLVGCPVLAITGNRLSRLAEYADLVLVSVCHEARRARQSPHASPNML